MKPVLGVHLRLALCAALLLAAKPLARAQSPAASGQANTAENSTIYDISALSRYEGRTIRQIEFQGIAGTDRDMLRSLLPMHPNEALVKEQLQQSLRTLYATGRFAALDVEADAAPGGEITLTYVAKENYFNGQIRVEGVTSSASPRPSDLVNSTRLDLGELFAEDEVVSGVLRMKKVLADNGYYESTITYRLTPHEETRQMDITFEVDHTRGRSPVEGTVKIHDDTGNVDSGQNPEAHQAQERRQSKQRASIASLGAAAQLLPEERPSGSAGATRQSRLSRRHQQTGLQLYRRRRRQGSDHGARAKKIRPKRELKKMSAGCTRRTPSMTTC